MKFKGKWLNDIKRLQMKVIQGRYTLERVSFSGSGMTTILQCMIRKLNGVFEGSEYRREIVSVPSPFIYTDDLFYKGGGTDCLVTKHLLRIR